MFNFKKRYAKTADHARSGSSKRFGNIKKEYEGIKFDSKIEIEIYKDLKVLQSEGVIKEVIAHPPYIEIYPSTKITRADGSSYLFRECRYYPDFSIVDNEGVTHYIDVKSFPTITADFILKYKMLWHQLGIYLNIIVKSNWKGQETVENIINGTHFSPLSKKALEKRN